MNYDEIHALNLGFIHSDEFTEANAKVILADAPAGTGRTRKPPAGLPAYLERLYDTPLLTAAQERHLFRQYNYLKFRASQLRDRLDRPNEIIKRHIERWHKAALGIRDRLIQSNLRLVVAMAKNNTGYDDLFERVSVGNVVLMRCVDRFDYSRGWKFSTYCCFALKVEFRKENIAEIKHRDKNIQWDDEAYVPTSHDFDANLETAENKATIKRLMKRLDDRQRDIIKRRYYDGKTLDEVSSELGITRERVRQIQIRALQRMAA